MDNKLEGLKMANELAAHGFIDDDDCGLTEERVNTTRALHFHKGQIAVAVPKLGDMKAFRGYTVSSRVDDADRAMISERLQAVMHDRAFVAQTPSLTASPASARYSDESRLGGTTLTASEEDARSEEEEEEVSTRSDKGLSLEDSDLIKSVKVHWRQSKWIADNIDAVRSPPTSNVRSSSDSDESQGGEDRGSETPYKAVVIWSNKAEKREGFNLLERMIVARLRGLENDYKKDVMVCEEVMDDGEFWLVLHKGDVVVAFPGRDGDEEFLESVQAMDKVWS